MSKKVDDIRKVVLLPLCTIEYLLLYPFSTGGNILILGSRCYRLSKSSNGRKPVIGHTQFSFSMNKDHRIPFARIGPATGLGKKARRQPCYGANTISTEAPWRRNSFRLLLHTFAA